MQKCHDLEMEVNLLKDEKNNLNAEYELLQKEVRTFPVFDLRKVPLLLVKRHLADRHSANGYFVERHLTDVHSANRRLLIKHLAEGHLANDHVADGHLPYIYLAPTDIWSTKNWLTDI